MALSLVTSTRPFWWFYSKRISMVNYQLNQLVVKTKTAIFPVESEDSGNELKSKVSPLSNKHFLNATY